MLTKCMGSPRATQPAWFYQMSEDLSYCQECVIQFHATMKLHCPSSSVVYKWNCRRICGNLEEALLAYTTEESIGDDTFYDGSSMKCIIETSVREILKHPRLMLNRQLHTLALKSIKVLLKNSQCFELQERLQGLCLLLVSQDSKVRYISM